MADTAARFRKRLSLYGPKNFRIAEEPPDRILVELSKASLEKIHKLKALLLRRGELEFAPLIEAKHDSLPFNMDEKRAELIDYLEILEEEEGGWDLDVDLSRLEFISKISGETVRFRWTPYMAKTVLAARHPLPASGSTFESLELDVENLPNLIHRYFELTCHYETDRRRFSTDDIAEVNLARDRSGRPALLFELEAGRKKDFEAFTGELLRKRLAVILDGKIITAPMITVSLPGSGIIAGPPTEGFTMEEQELLIVLLEGGGLKVQPVLMEEEFLDPVVEQSVQGKTKKDGSK